VFDLIIRLVYILAFDRDRTSIGPLHRYQSGIGIDFSVAHRLYSFSSITLGLDTYPNPIQFTSCIFFRRGRFEDGPVRLVAQPWRLPPG
jgi:hypothetical protein